MMSLFSKVWGKSLHLSSNILSPQEVLFTLKSVCGVHISRMTPPTIYRDVEAVLNVFNNYKADDCSKVVKSLLEIYNNALKEYQQGDDSGKSKQHPLIILEGLDGSGKSTVGKKLASKLKAKSWCTPPKSIKHIRHLFDDHLDLRNAYYALGNYIAALEVAVVLKEHPVIMDRYWHSTAAYAIAQAVHDFPNDVEMPPEGDNFYNWPNGLLKPDTVLFLDVREDIRRQRISRRTNSTSQEKLLKENTNFRKNIILAYKNMVDPQVTFVNANGDFPAVLQEIDTQINHLFKKCNSTIC